MSSSPSSSSSSSSTPADSGPANLGSMSSLSSTCTPLKHRYDACFNAWFQDYLGAGSPSAQQPAEPVAAKPAARRRMGFFGGGGGGGEEETSIGGAGGAGGAGVDSAQREAKRNDLEEKCGAFFREYQACVKRALREKDLLPLLSQAREYNPFPFPAQSSGGKATESETGNSPFPFAAASKEERMEWERREGW